MEYSCPTERSCWFSESELESDDIFLCSMSLRRFALSIDCASSLRHESINDEGDSAFPSLISWDPSFIWIRAWDRSFVIHWCVCFSFKSWYCWIRADTAVDRVSEESTGQIPKLAISDIIWLFSASRITVFSFSISYYYLCNSRNLTFSFNFIKLSSKHSIWYRSAVLHSSWNLTLYLMELVCDGNVRLKEWIKVIIVVRCDTTIGGAWEFRDRDCAN